MALTWMRWKVPVVFLLFGGYLQQTWVIHYVASVILDTWDTNFYSFCIGWLVISVWLAGERCSFRSSHVHPDLITSICQAWTSLEYFVTTVSQNLDVKLNVTTHCVVGHFLKQWQLVYWRMYASRGLVELINYHLAKAEKSDLKWSSQ